jgi:hypothetical protein
MWSRRTKAVAHNLAPPSIVASMLYSCKITCHAEAGPLATPPKHTFTYSDGGKEKHRVFIYGICTNWEEWRDGEPRGQGGGGGFINSRIHRPDYPPSNHIPPKKKTIHLIISLVSAHSVESVMVTLDGIELSLHVLNALLYER